MYALYYQVEDGHLSWIGEADTTVRARVLARVCSQGSQKPVLVVQTGGGAPLYTYRNGEPCSGAAAIN